METSIILVLTILFATNVISIALAIMANKRYRDLEKAHMDSRVKLGQDLFNLYRNVI